MGIRKKNDDNALTAEEIAFLRSSQTPEAIKAYVARHHESIGLRTAAFQKVAAAARAEREALMEIKATQVLRASIEAPTHDARAIQLERQVRALVEHNDRLMAEVRRQTALPAMAVSSAD